MKFDPSTLKIENIPTLEIENMKVVAYYKGPRDSIDLIVQYPNGTYANYYVCGPWHSRAWEYETLQEAKKYMKKHRSLSKLQWEETHEAKEGKGDKER